MFQARHISWGPSVIFASFCLVANLLVLTLPETGHRQLPQTVGDIRRWSDEEDDIWNTQHSQQLMRSFWTGNQQETTRNIENETRFAILFISFSSFSPPSFLFYLLRKIDVKEKKQSTKLIIAFFQVACQFSNELGGKYEITKSMTVMVLWWVRN